MACLGEIDGGAQEARAELFFLVSLLVDLAQGVEPKRDISGALGFAEVASRIATAPTLRPYFQNESNPKQPEPMRDRARFGEQRIVRKAPIPARPPAR